MRCKHLCTSLLLQARTQGRLAAGLTFDAGACMQHAYEGTYQVAYKGKHGQQTATVRLRNGVVNGMDAGGGIWKGTYRPKKDAVLLEITVSTPGLIGVRSVFDGTEGPIIRRVAFALPLELRETQHLDLATNLGPLRIYLDRIDD